MTACFQCQLKVFPFPAGKGLLELKELELLAAAVELQAVLLAPQEQAVLAEQEFELAVLLVLQAVLQEQALAVQHFSKHRQEPCQGL
jgi:hypothetical protein